MKALLITAERQSVEAIEITGMQDIVKLIGYDTIESDAVGNKGDRLYFDEECFLRGSEGRFQLDSLIPISGKAVVVGSVDNGASLRDVQTIIGDLRSRIKYL